MSVLTSVLRPVLQPVRGSVFDASEGGSRPWDKSVATAVLMGDSLTADCGQTASTLSQTIAYGYFTWANALSGARFKVIANAGAGGQTSAQILARFDSDVVSRNPRSVFVLAGTNDAIGSSAQTIQNLQAMYEAASVAGIYVFAIAVYWAPSYGPEKIADISAVNAWIESYASSRPGIEFIKTDSLIGRGDCFRDQVHLNPRGAHLVGTQLAPSLSSWGNPHDLPSSPLDTQSYLSSNPLLAGTTSSKTNGTFTGLLPSGIELGFGATDTPSTSIVGQENGLNFVRVSGTKVAGAQTGIRMYAAPSVAPATTRQNYGSVRKLRINKNTGAINGFLFGSSNGLGSRAFLASNNAAGEYVWPESTDWLTIVSPPVAKSVSPGGEFLACFSRLSGEFEFDFAQWSLVATDDA